MKKRILIVFLINLVLVTLQFSRPTYTTLGYVEGVRKLDDLEDLPEFQVGLWYSPYVKIYSIGGHNRVAELSTYPRAYKDTDPHVYEKDEPFIVTKDDLNWDDNGTPVYLDSRDKIFHIGDKAIHYTGESLPGAFPLWIESENIPYIIDKDNFHVFSLSTLPGQITNLVEGSLYVDGVFTKLDDATLESTKQDISSDKLTFLSEIGDSDKQIIRVRYQRGS